MYKSSGRRREGEEEAKAYDKAPWEGGNEGKREFYLEYSIPFPLSSLSPVFSFRPFIHGGDGDERTANFTNIFPNECEKSVVLVTLSIRTHRLQLLSSTTRDSSCLFPTTFQLFIDVEIHS